MTDAVSVVTGFIDALDRGDIDDVESRCDAGGSWWVDTGFDRAAGLHGHDPGADRPWPLHGTMPLIDKVRLLRGLPTRFPDGVRQRRWHAFGDDAAAVVEVEGEGRYATGAEYANRYAFVATVSDGRVLDVREYLDTAHAADVFEGRNLDRRTVGPPPEAVEIVADGPLVELALAFVAAIDRADPSGVAALAADGSTWWADTGVNRRAGRFDREPRSGPDVPLAGMVRLHDRITQLPGLVTAFPGGWSLRAQRVIAGAASVAVEAASNGVKRNGDTYQNRYCFVLDVTDGRIAAVREYCDTRHAFDIFGLS